MLPWPWVGASALGIFSPSTVYLNSIMSSKNQAEPLMALSRSTLMEEPLDWRTAGKRSSRQRMRPYRSCIAFNPGSTPGTAISWLPEMKINKLCLALQTNLSHISLDDTVSEVLYRKPPMSLIVLFCVRPETPPEGIAQSRWFSLLKFLV